MRDIEYGTRYLIVTCYSKTDGQVRGLYEVIRLLEKRRVVQHHSWNGEKLSLVKRRVLKWVIMCGHGAEDDAGLSDGERNRLRPKDVSFPVDIDVYLLGCYQGKKKIKRKWVEDTGMDVNRIHGCKGETESALSILFLLNILQDGPDKAGWWFKRWNDANDYFRVWFPVMRDIYKECERDFLLAIERISEKVDLESFEDLWEIGKKHPWNLSGLG